MCESQKAISAAASGVAPACLSFCSDIDCVAQCLFAQIGLVRSPQNGQCGLNCDSSLPAHLQMSMWPERIITLATLHNGPKKQQTAKLHKMKEPLPNIQLPRSLYWWQTVLPHQSAHLSSLKPSDSVYQLLCLPLHSIQRGVYVCTSTTRSAMWDPTTPLPMWNVKASLLPLLSSAM